MAKLSNKHKDHLMVSVTKNPTMQTSTLVVLACLLAVVVAQAQQEPQPVADIVQESSFDTPVHDSSPRTKRGLLLLKKKLILGALGLKVAKVGAAAGVVGALAYKAKSKPNW
ncbi:unnamed protein product [Arctia plantaginis]|uniref:Transmembrane protein n=1 Tax=Arctia plantaginis TaxID=874455 RepID=A0A8S1A4F3_ARCPL|nr:unnamed protein product [Arctia plantaginis]